MSQEKVVDSLKQIDWKSFFQGVMRTGTRFDQPSSRFIKGDLLCYGIEKRSDGKWKYVDAIGYDQLNEELGVKLEVRSQKELFCKNGNIRASVKIKNGQGETTEFNPPPNWYMLLVQTTRPFMVSLVNADTVKEYAQTKGNEVSFKSGCDDYVQIASEEIVDIEEYPFGEFIKELAWEIF